MLLALSTCVDDALDIGEDGASRFRMRLAPTSFPGFNPVSARLVSNGNLSDRESRAATSAAICLRDHADQPRRVFCDARGNVLVEGATHAVLLTSDGRVRTEERQIVEAAPNSAELVGDTMPNLPEQTLPEEPGDVAEVVFVDGGLELQVNGEAVEFEPCDTNDPEDTERAYTQLIAGLAAQGFEVDESYDGEMPDDEYEMDDEEDDEEEMDAEYADEPVEEAKFDKKAQWMSRFYDELQKLNPTLASNSMKWGDDATFHYHQGTDPKVAAARIAKLGDSATESLDEADMEVAKTILQQLGGKQFQMMTGAKNFVADENSLKFKIGSNAKRVGYVRIQLDPDDTYTVQFMSSSGKLIKELDMIYADQLQSVFTDYTGMYTRLF